MDSYGLSKIVGELVHLCLKKDGLGFDVFNVTNDTITANMPTSEFSQKYCPDVAVTREIGEHEAPRSNRKARDVLGFREAHPWRTYVGA